MPPTDREAATDTPAHQGGGARHCTVAVAGGGSRRARRLGGGARWAFGRAAPRIEQPRRVAGAQMQ
eukprot:gene7114-4852_t